MDTSTQSAMISPVGKLYYYLVSKVSILVTIVVYTYMHMYMYTMYGVCTLTFPGRRVSMCIFVTIIFYVLKSNLRDVSEQLSLISK